MLQTMIDARATGDAPTLRRTAHTLKPQAADFGADDLVASCRAVEAAASTGSIDGHLIEDVVARASIVEAEVRLQLS
jgi:HPt (histidine-containing phosphotransfer) domain-containing protein